MKFLKTLAIFLYALSSITCFGDYTGSFWIEACKNYKRRDFNNTIECLSKGYENTGNGFMARVFYFLAGADEENEQKTQFLLDKAIVLDMSRKPQEAEITAGEALLLLEQRNDKSTPIYKFQKDAILSSLYFFATKSANKRPDNIKKFVDNKVQKQIILLNNYGLILVPSTPIFGTGHFESNQLAKKIEEKLLQQGHRYTWHRTPCGGVAFIWDFIDAKNTIKFLEEDAYPIKKIVIIEDHENWVKDIFNAFIAFSEGRASDSSRLLLQAIRIINTKIAYEQKNEDLEEILSIIIADSMMCNNIFGASYSKSSAEALINHLKKYKSSNYANELLSGFLISDPLISQSSSFVSAIKKLPTIGCTIEITKIMTHTCLLLPNVFWSGKFRELIYEMEMAGNITEGTHTSLLTSPSSILIIEHNRRDEILYLLNFLKGLLFLTMDQKYEEIAKASNGRLLLSKDEIISLLMPLIGTKIPE